MLAWEIDLGWAQARIAQLEVENEQLRSIDDKMVEAAGRAMCLARKPRHPSISDDDHYWRTFGARELYLKLARIALEAALADSH